MWKTYSHTIKFTGTPLPHGTLFNLDSPLFHLHCTACYGSGREPQYYGSGSSVDSTQYYGPGAVMIFPIPICKICNGRARRRFLLTRLDYANINTAKDNVLARR
jgi:hypothetical protein